MANLDDLRALGYSVEIAHGDAQVERDALEAARARAREPQVRADVQELANRAAVDLGRMGKTPEEIVPMIAELTATAVESITAARSSEVAFHERALAIAEAMPTVYTINGPGFSGLQVATAADGSEAIEPGSVELVDALANQAGHTERVFQAEADPAAVEAVLELRARGADVVAEATPGGFRVTVDGSARTSLAGLEAELAARPRTAEAGGGR